MTELIYLLLAGALVVVSILVSGKDTENKKLKATIDENQKLINAYYESNNSKDSDKRRLEIELRDAQFKLKNKTTDKIPVMHKDGCASRNVKASEFKEVLFRAFKEGKQAKHKAAESVDTQFEKYWDEKYQYPDRRELFIEEVTLHGRCRNYIHVVDLSGPKYKACP